MDRDVTPKHEGGLLMRKGKGQEEWVEEGTCKKPERKPRIAPQSVVPVEGKAVNKMGRLEVKG